jgi:hydrogenase nickel incorporation protein HypA/HybF
MHETGIAAEILALAETEARKHGALAIRGVVVRIGDLAGVVSDSLMFAFDALKAGTLASEAAIHIERVPTRARCRSCGTDHLPGADLVLWCPVCRNPLEVISGRELDLLSLDLETGEP